MVGERATRKWPPQDDGEVWRDFVLEVLHPLRLTFQPANRIDVVARQLRFLPKMCLKLAGTNRYSCHHTAKIQQEHEGEMKCLHYE